MAEDNYNCKNLAVKRILQEEKEMQVNPSDDFMCFPLEENIFEWQFAIDGPQDTEFEGGIYHGRIQLPAELVWRPLFQPNGRFETQTRVCLCISNHHPERWQPSWSVRTALVELIAFMLTSPNGALGSLDYPKEDRQVLAIKFRQAAPKGVKDLLMNKAPLVSQLSSPAGSEHRPHDAEDASQENLPDGKEAAGEELRDPVAADTIVEDVPEVSIDPNSNPSLEGKSVATEAPSRGLNSQPLQRPQTRTQKPADDRLFTLGCCWTDRCNCGSFSEEIHEL